MTICSRRGILVHSHTVSLTSFAKDSKCLLLDVDSFAHNALSSMSNTTVAFSCTIKAQGTLARRPWSEVELEASIQTWHPALVPAWERFCCILSRSSHAHVSVRTVEAPFASTFGMPCAGLWRSEHHQIAERMCSRRENSLRTDPHAGS